MSNDVTITLPKHKYDAMVEKEQVTQAVLKKKLCKVPQLHGSGFGKWLTIHTTAVLNVTDDVLIVENQRLFDKLKDSERQVYKLERAEPKVINHVTQGEPIYLSFTAHLGWAILLLVTIGWLS